MLVVGGLVERMAARADQPLLGLPLQRRRAVVLGPLGRLDRLGPGEAASVVVVVLRDRTALAAQER